MKLIDVEPIIKNLSAMKTQLGYDAIKIDGMIKALREAEEVTAAQQPNAPLTLEELRERDGEPVWIAAKGIGRYDIYQGCANRCLEQFYKAALPSSGYGTDWLDYRRKPKELEGGIEVC